MENLIVLSIIIPVFNSEKYLGECLESIFKQETNSKYEVICVDDGSLDNSYNILTEYSKKYSNLVVLQKENGGASSARNLGIQHAKGQYLWFVDSDDYIFDGVLDICNYLNKKQLDLFTFVWDYNKIFNKPFLEESVKLDSNFGLGHSSWANIVKASIIKNNNIRFDEKLVYGEDILFWYTTLLFVNNVYQIDSCIYYYREHQESIIHKTKTEQEVVARILNELKIIKTLKDYRNYTNLHKNKLKVYDKMIYFGGQRIMQECLPYSGYSYKDCVKIIKDNHLIFPFKFRITALKSMKEKSFVQKLKKIYAVIFPLRHFKTHYKKTNKNKGLCNA